jgi:hypothetical protein
MGDYLAIPRRLHNDSAEPLALLLTDLERAFLDLVAAVETACESLEVPERRRPSIEAIRDANDTVRVAIQDALDEYAWRQRRILREIARGAAS